MKRFKIDESQEWSPDCKRLGSAKEVAAYLGCGVKHIYNLVWKKELPATKAGGLKFKGLDVQNFVEEREKWAY